MSRETKKEKELAAAKKRARASWINARAQIRTAGRYRGTGINMPKRWDNFDNFYADMGGRPAGLVLTRKNSELGYTKKNCVWGSRSEASSNRKWNNTVTYKGESQPVFEWARRNGINPMTLLSRLRRGMSATEAIERPIPTRRTVPVGSHYFSGVSHNRRIVVSVVNP
jgi:hypothetical protein